ncbi:TonB family protein [Luteimonas soli]|uniref:Protein TonB n=1 Tax=Luteimonas soli TaxID=1648966 RepID=A0ABV7XPF7_9GAMM
MTQAELFRWLVESTCASSAAIVLVLVLRRPLRSAFGANAAYLLWLLPPLAVLAASLPARVVRVVVSEAAGNVGVGRVGAGMPLDTTTPAVGWLLPAWFAGVAGFALWQFAVQRRFRRSLGALRMGADGHLRAEASAGLPAVVGLRARIVLPADFEARYGDDERALILAHERIHLARRDVLGNALLAALRCAYWFNPLAWLAADRFRRDQELACDETVVARHPRARRVYGEAMVKTQLSAMPAPLACHWFGGHPLKERIAMLKRPVPGPRRIFAGLATAAVVVAGASYAVWTMRPATRVIAGGDTSSPAAGASTIALSAVDRPVREIALEAAERAGIRVLNPQALAEKPVTMEFSSVSIETVMKIAAEESGLVASFDGGNVSFLASTEAIARGKTSTVADAGASVDIRSKNLAPPKYPAEAVAAKITGKVVVIVDVAADGSVSGVRVEKSQPAGVFDEATLEAVRKWTFEPAIKDGRPVAGRVRVPVDFAMDAPASAPAGGKA